MTDVPVDDVPDAPAEPTTDEPRIELRYESRMSEYLRSVAWAGRRSDVAFGIGVAGIVGGVVAFAFGDRLTFWFPLLLGLSLVTGVFAIPFFWYAIRRQPGLIGARIEDDPGHDPPIVPPTGLTSPGLLRTVRPRCTNQAKSIAVVIWA